MITIFVADDHELYLEGLCLLLKKQEGLEVKGSAVSGAELLKRLPEIEVDILLLDVHMPDMDEEELLRQVRELRPQIKIIYLTMMRGTRYIHKLTRLGIQGYLLKNTKIAELREAIESVYRGGTYFSKDVNLEHQEKDFRNTISIQEKNVAEILSKRELEILQLICKEFSNAEIAAKLFLSISTVETHRKNLIAKLGVNNTVGLVKFAIRNGVVE